jgi:hypothetical protein
MRAGLLVCRGMKNLIESLERREMFSVSLTGDVAVTTPVVEEQTLVVAQSTGAGAGKVTFNPFSITRKIDRSSPVFF